METITIECPVCKKKGNVSSAFIGKQMRCNCGNVILIKSKDEVCLIPPKDEKSSFKDEELSDNDSSIAEENLFLNKIWPWCKNVANKIWPWCKIILNKIWLWCKIILNKIWLWCKIIFNIFILWGVRIIYGNDAVEMLQNYKKGWIPEKDGE